MLSRSLRELGRRPSLRLCVARAWLRRPGAVFATVTFTLLANHAKRLRRRLSKHLSLRISGPLLPATPASKGLRFPRVAPATLHLSIRPPRSRSAKTASCLPSAWDRGLSLRFASLLVRKARSILRPPEASFHCPHRIASTCLYTDEDNRTSRESRGPRLGLRLRRIVYDFRDSRSSGHPAFGRTIGQEASMSPLRVTLLATIG